MPIYGALSKKKINDGVIASKDFKLSSMRGITDRRNTDFGILPDNWVTVYKNERDNPDQGIVYTIFSYATPIAWRLTDGTWIVPPVRYSVTTTGHQSAVRYALSRNGWKQLANTSWWER